MSNNTPAQVLAEGVLPDGRHVKVLERDGGYWDRFEVLIDGAAVEITEMPSRLRDGGTTTIPTAAGRIHLPRKIGRDPGPDTVDGVEFS